MIFSGCDRWPSTFTQYLYSEYVKRNAWVVTLFRIVNFGDGKFSTLHRFITKGERTCSSLLVKCHKTVLLSLIELILMTFGVCMVSFLGKQKSIDSRASHGICHWFLGRVFLHISFSLISQIVSEF